MAKNKKIDRPKTILPESDGAQSSPMGSLCQSFMEAEHHRSLDELGSLYMRALSEQFATSVADGNLEASMAMLAGCPALARMPCAKSLISALHYSCASARMAPLTRALLALGCDPQGNPRAPGQVADGSSSPLRWAASSGSLGAIQALLKAGAKPKIGDLHEACRQARGDCVSALLSAAPKLDPFKPFGGHKTSCDAALRTAASERRAFSPENRLSIEMALADFERWALKRELDTSADGGNSTTSQGSKRL